MYNSRIRLLVVTYKTPFKASETLTSLVRYCMRKPSAVSNFKLSVWDNSPSCRSEELAEIIHGTAIAFVYTSTPENLALSKVYNRTIDHRTDFDYLCILDQDTQLTDKYLDEIQILAEQKVNLALPQVYSNSFLYSPSYRIFCLGRHFSKVSAGSRKAQNILAVNSGMLIRSDIFDFLRYDERISFYGTDTWFMVQYQKSHKEIFVMAAKLNHSLRIQENNTQEWWRKYYLMQIQGNKIIFNNGLAEKLVTWLYCKYLEIFHARS
jgi:GT2 family glycosyltransferase